MSADLVPVDNMAALNAMPAEVREVQVTRMLSEARSWLAHAVEATAPVTIANFKAQMATVVEATKQLNLSKEIQLDAIEMLRRAERGVGKAIRQGQDEGTIRTTGQREHVANQHTVAALVDNESSTFSPTDFATTAELTGNNAGIYDLTDDVSDEQFEEAITEAKAEENLSRANVVRKTTYSAPAPRPPTAARTPSRRPLPDAFSDAVYDLRKRVATLHNLAADDRFAANKEKVAAKNRSDLIRARDALDRLLEQLD